jgi:hypothetical protein
MTKYVQEIISLVLDMTANPIKCGSIGVIKAFY